MATTRREAQAALAGRIAAFKTEWDVGHYALQIEMPNGQEVNKATQSDPYLKVSIVYQDGDQIDLSNRPGNRVLGSIVLEAYSKEGSGTILGNDLLEAVYRRVHMTDTMPPLRTLAARFGTRPPKDGWQADAAIIPFWYDSLP